MIEDFRLSVFLAVVETGSFTKAARRLGITQPAVSQHVAELEKQLSTTLFERSGNGVALTTAGSVFQAYAKQIGRTYEAVNGLFGKKEAFSSGVPVTLATTSFLSTYFLPEVLSRIEAVSETRFIIKTYPESAFDGRMPNADVLIFTTKQGEKQDDVIATLDVGKGLRVQVRFVSAGLFSGTALCAYLKSSLTPE